MKETPSQTAGPYVHIGLMPNSVGIKGVYVQDVGSVAVSDANAVLTGCIYDGDGQLVKDAVVEVWQADIAAFGRTAADAETGIFRFALRQSDDSFLTLWIVARGINIGLHTRVYWPGSTPDLPAVSKARLQTLVARETAPNTYQFDIHLQGPDETIFFDI